MIYSQACVDLVKRSEGCKLAAYQDGAGVWTIGYGHTGPLVEKGTIWTQAQADAQLAADLQIASELMLDAVHVPLTQGQADALTDFVFNLGIGRLGTSTLLRKLNMKLYSEIPAEISKWVYAGGEIEQGLVTRRAAEVALWEQA